MAVQDKNSGVNQNLSSNLCSARHGRQRTLRGYLAHASGESEEGWCHLTGRVFRVWAPANIVLYASQTMMLCILMCGMCGSPSL